MEKAAKAASSLVFGFVFGVFCLVYLLLRVRIVQRAEPALQSWLGLCGRRSSAHSRKVPPRSSELSTLRLRAPVAAPSAEAPLLRLLLLTLLVVCVVCVVALRRRRRRGLRVPVSVPDRVPRGLVRVSHPAGMRSPHHCQNTLLVALDTRRAVLQRTRNAVLDSHRSQSALLVQELAAERVCELVGPALRAQVAGLAAPSLAAEVVECAAGTRVLEAHAVLIARIAAAGDHGALLVVMEDDHRLEAGLLGRLCLLTSQTLSAVISRLGGGVLRHPVQIQVAPATVLLPLYNSQLANAAAVAEGAVAEGEVLDERALRAHLRDDKASHLGKPTKRLLRGRIKGIRLRGLNS